MVFFPMIAHQGVLPVGGNSANSSFLLLRADGLENAPALSREGKRLGEKGKGRSQISRLLLIIYYVQGTVRGIRKGEHKIQTKWREKTY